MDRPLKSGGSAAIRLLPAALLLCLGAAIAILARFEPAPPRPPAGPPERIVSLAPSITEILFAVGAGDRLAGVTAHCDYPAAVTTKARIGGYDNPSVERVIALGPDLVIVPAEGDMLGATEQIRTLGVRVEPVTVASLDDLGPAVERVALLAGAAEKGRALARSLEARIEGVRRATAGLERPRALLAVDREPAIAAGRGTFGDDLLRAAGARNAAEGALSSYPELGMEAILAAAPEVIVDASMAPAGEAERAALARGYWSRFPDLPAVRSGRVLAIDPDLIVRPGPRLVDGLERLARAIHPEAFR